MTALLEEPCRFCAQQNSPVVLKEQPFQGLLFGRRQVLLLLFEIERFEPWLEVVDAAAMALLQGLDPLQERDTARLGYSVREIVRWVQIGRLWKLTA